MDHPRSTDGRKGQESQEKKESLSRETENLYVFQRPPIPIRRSVRKEDSVGWRLIHKYWKSERCQDKHRIGVIIE